MTTCFLHGTCDDRPACDQIMRLQAEMEDAEQSHNLLLAGYCQALGERYLWHATTWAAAADMAERLAEALPDDPEAVALEI